MSKLIANADDYSTEEIDAKFAKMSAACAKKMDGTPSKKIKPKAKRENYIHAGVSYKGEEKEYIPGFHGTAEQKARSEEVIRKYASKKK